jgi:hypothetical protein
MDDGLNPRLAGNRDKGRMSDDQHEFGRSVVLAGWEYHVARSIGDVQKIGL